MCGRTDKNRRYEFDAGAKITANRFDYVIYSKCCTEVMFFWHEQEIAQPSTNHRIVASFIHDLEKCQIFRENLLKLFFYEMARLCQIE